MWSLFGKLLPVEPDEVRKTSLLFAQNFVVVAITIAGKAARDTFFLSRFDKQYLPLMFLFSAVAVAAGAGWYSRMSQRTSRIKLLHITCAVLACGLMLLQWRVEGWVIPVLYVWTELIISLVTMQFWLAAGAVFDARQAKRLFSVIGAGGSLAAMAVGLSLKPVVKQIGPAKVLPAVVAGIVLFWLLGQFVHPVSGGKSRRRRAPASQDNSSKGYLTSIAVVVALSALVTQVVDYQFKIISSRAFPQEADLIGFFGQFAALTGLCTLLMQFLVTGRVLSRFGLIAGLAALPLLLSGSTFAVLLSPRLLSAVLAKFSDQTLKFSLHNSAMELLWLPVAPELQSRARPVVSGAVKAWAEGLAGLLVFFLAKLLGFDRLGVLTLTAVTVWLVAVVRLRQQYARALSTALAKRQIDLESIRVNPQDPEVVKVIGEALRNGDEPAQHFVLDLLEGLPLKPWAPVLREVFQRGSPSVQTRLLALAERNEGLLPDEWVVNVAAQQGPAACEALRIAGRRRLDAGPLLRERLADPDVDIRAAAAAAVIESGQGALAEAEHTLAALLRQDDARSQRAAILRLGPHPSLLSAEMLNEFLASRHSDVRRSALVVAADRRDRRNLPSIIACVASPATSQAARDALRASEPQEFIGGAREVLGHPGSSLLLRVNLIRALADTGSPQAAAVLLDELQPHPLALADACAGGLLAIARREPLGRKLLNQLTHKIQELARVAYRANRMLLQLPSDEDARLLRDHCQNTASSLLNTMLRLGATRFPQTPVETCIQLLRSGDRARRALALESIDAGLALGDRRLIGPLVETESPAQREEARRKLFPDLETPLDDALSSMARSGHEWESAIAIDYLRKTGRAVAVDINWESASSAGLRREAWLQRPPDGQMYGNLEKTILLKSVGLFESIAAENLSGIARIAEEVTYPPAATIFGDGDPAESLYIVATGAVRIHKGDSELAVLRRGECLGEMALLDGAPRSAAATTIEETTLLEIDQDDFFEVLAANPEITRGIMRLLSRRLRDASQKLAAATNTA